MRCMNRHLLLLAFCQGLFLTNNVTFIAINGLVGLAWRRWAGWRRCRSRPMWWGAALSAMPVSRLQARLGPQAFVPDRLAGGHGDVPHCARWRWRRAQLLAAGGCPRWWRASTAPTARCTALPGPSWWRRVQGARHLAGCWPVASWVPSSGRTWPAPRAAGWPCPSPGPTWRWWAWRCCRWWLVSFIRLPAAHVAAGARCLARAALEANRCGSRCSSSPSWPRRWAMA
jgi:hypothetical protein